MRVVTFGEVMIRLAPEEFLRLRQTLPGCLEATFGGGEVNVAVSLAMQGANSAFLTALPDNSLTEAFTQELGKLGVDADLVERSGRGRFGIYFVETGANQRPGTVTYDRNGSSIALKPAEEYDWANVFSEANWFHVTGITPAISVHAAQATLEAVKQAKDRGVTVSCDLNFRKKLWNWKPNTQPTTLAQETMQQVMPFVDVVIANEEDAEKVLGIAAAESDVEAGQLNRDGYRQVAAEITKQYPQVKLVAITLRESLSASHNNWGAMLYETKTANASFAPLNPAGQYAPYEIRSIVDRVGAGDSFAGALIFALNDARLSEPETALRYATAASCLKHSIKGDFNYATREEIEALMGGDSSGRVQR